MRGTTIEYVDVYANKDDGIEFFSGTVSAKYLSVYYVGDDSFDFDEGLHRYLQFLVSIQMKIQTERLNGMDLRKVTIEKLIHQHYLTTRM